jgi:hypothetical protein
MARTVCVGPVARCACGGGLISATEPPSKLTFGSKIVGTLSEEDVGEAPLVTAAFGHPHSNVRLNWLAWRLVYSGRVVYAWVARHERI